ncbi:cell wall protein [Hamadaea tsunoensis]|uniref:cell wall protein n=1 Tax=Hamadaea tsunoensis TaxID=53368 RepID=UPI000423ED9D|nr:cell wall protein [Hamadaea tsunoensis]
MDRRALLTSAVLAGATAFGSLAPETAFAQAAAQPVQPGEKDPNFAEGRVTGLVDTMLMVTGSDNTLWRIRITQGTSIWKLRPTTLDKVAVGDGLYARGARLADGTLAADAVWVNIVNLQVHIAALSRNTIHFDHRGKRVVGHVVPGTSAAVYNGTPAIGDMSMVQVGKHAQVIGAWLPDTNEIEIATLHTSA